MERAFSILKYIYTEQQSSSMVDLIKTTLMLDYNKKDFFDDFFSNFNRSLEGILMTDFFKHLAVNSFQKNMLSLSLPRTYLETLILLT